MKTGRRLRLFIIARIIVTLLFLVSVIVLKLQDQEAIDNVAFKGIVQLMAFSCVLSAISLAALRRTTWLLALTYLQIIWDLLFVTLLLVFTDGIASPFSFLYLLAVMNAGMLLSRREAIYTAALCAILYGAMVDFQYYGLLSNIGLTPLAALQRGAAVVFYTIFLHLTGFVLTAFIAGYLAERARSSEDALRVTEVNYEELNRLHSTIVQHLEYGLMTVTREGNIQVFNPYLQAITSMSQEEAYGRPSVSVFPALPDGDEAFSRYCQGEFSYQHSKGDSIIIGYASVPFHDARGEVAGIIVTLRNLTYIRQMEVALKRSDQLAALGELSARMAHEIRNPLAAISGSVQLLAGNGCLRQNESRLLEIVLRESERLNGLITDFLNYARPLPPKYENFDFTGFVEDLVTLLTADTGFERTIISTDLQPGIKVSADRGQLQQVLINLMQNGAESMPAGGVLNLAASMQQGEDDSGHHFSLLRISVADRGPGLAFETRRHLFEPFWTTKANGTGLGLATVYRIVEGHGGSISADEREGGGTVFTLLLPTLEEH